MEGGEKRDYKTKETELGEYFVHHTTALFSSE
jgi:hypothetical protein